MLQAVFDRMGAAKRSLGDGAPAVPADEAEATRATETATAVPADRLRAMNEAQLGRPDGWTPVAQLEKQLQRRREALDTAKIDWGHAESLAFGSLLEDGVAIRLTGQDAQRGTFSHRHATVHDAATGATWTPLEHLASARASFEIHNSPLSEMAAVGFEYGYSVADPAALVIWEAQFGDFANGAQVMFDQFLSSGAEKWGQTSGMMLLLPHGYEGQGPEHSSARLERFLQLCAQDNLRVAYCTTSAQYFHLVRRQAALLGSDPRPLVVMSPKSLLRHPVALAALEQLAEGAFHPVLADDTVAGREGEVTRLLLCSGKVYADLVAAAEVRQAARPVALARVEELYPFPADALAAMVAGFPALREVVWVQEEPRNMGAWSFAEPRLRGLLPDGVRLDDVGRPDRASPAVGTLDRHRAEQARIVQDAWTWSAEPAAANGRGGSGKRRAPARAAAAAVNTTINAESTQNDA